MKKTALLTIALAMVLSFSFAQEPARSMPNKNGQPEKMHAGKQDNCMEPQAVNPMMLKMKKEFIQENFVIESNKKEAFWNAYNNYEKEILAAHRAQREFRKNNNIPVKMTADSLSTLSDAAILSYYENNFTTKSELLKAEEKFFNNLRTILSPQQIAQYYILEKNFHKSASKMNKPQPMKMEGAPMKMEAKPMTKDMQVAPMDKPNR